MELEIKVLSNGGRLMQDWSTELTRWLAADTIQYLERIFSRQITLNEIRMSYGIDRSFYHIRIKMENRKAN